MSFDEFIAIDWSGAVKANGIAIAQCDRGTNAPKLISPPSRRWTRQTAAAWVLERLSLKRRLLVGFDFAFSMPFEEQVGFLAGRAPGIEDVFDLWEAVEQASSASHDFGCGAFLDDPRYSPLYWNRRIRPADWIARQRRTEVDCGRETSTYPQSVFKAHGPSQVCKASLTGIRVLRHIRERGGAAVAIWPFEPMNECKSVMVEIYPTLFRKRAPSGNKKVKTAEVLNAALVSLRSDRVEEIAVLTDHDTDALISAAGLRYLVNNGWVAGPISDPIVMREGWIMGVPPFGLPS
jgi:hypothetical protein